MITNVIGLTLFWNFLLIVSFSAESDEMNLRRISYLMATKDDRMQPGSDIEEEEEEFVQITSTDSRR